MNDNFKHDVYCASQILSHMVEDLHEDGILTDEQRDQVVEAMNNLQITIG